MSDDAPIVYLILGAPGAGRREVVADLVEGGLEETDQPVIFLSSDEAADPADARLGPVERWTWTEDNRIAAAWPEGAAVGFFVVDGRRSPVDQIEAFKPWLREQAVELARVICVYHCALVAEHSPLRLWYDACVHFSDLVLLNRREDVPNKWISELRTSFAKQCLPCLVEMVKKGRVANPGLVLDTQVRRLSQWFDEEDDDWMSMVDGDTEIIIEDEPGEGAADADDDELMPEEDPYLVRHPSGLRQKDVPDITHYLR